MIAEHICLRGPARAPPCPRRLLFIAISRLFGAAIRRYQLDGSVWRTDPDAFRETRHAQLGAQGRFHRKAHLTPRLRDVPESRGTRESPTNEFLRVSL